MVLPIANTITPLMGANFVYLFVINAFIGLLEGKLLKRWFAGGPRAVWWMIAANYLSAWVGWLALTWLVHSRIEGLLGRKPIERINSLAAAIVLIAFAITIVVEVCFVHFAAQRARRSPGHTLLATVCVNTVSYLIICLWFLWTSFTLPLNARVRPLHDLGKLPAGTLYWVDSAGQVIARKLDRSESDQRVGQVMQNEFVWPYQLRIEPGRISDRLQLSVQYARRVIPPNLEPPEGPLLADVGPMSVFQSDYWEQSRFLRKSVLDLRSTETRQMHVDFDWYRKWLDTNVPDGPHSHLIIGLASIDWDMQEPTILPDDKIVFEWSGQIILFDPHTRKLAFVARGTCPAFIPNAK